MLMPRNLDIILKIHNYYVSICCIKFQVIMTIYYDTIKDLNLSSTTIDNYLINVLSCLLATGVVFYLSMVTATSYSYQLLEIKFKVKFTLEFIKF